MPERKAGHSVVFKIDDDNNGTYTQIAQVKSIQPGGIITEKIEDTVLDDTRWHYSPAGVNEDGEYTFVLVWDPNTATHATLRALSEARTAFGVQIVFSQFATTKTWQCSLGFITEFTMGEVASKTVMMATVKYQPQSLPTLT